MKLLIIITLSLAIAMPIVLVPVPVVAQCNNDNVCDPGETFSSCPSDCGILPADCERVERDPSHPDYSKITSDCQIDHVAQLFINVSNWILRVMGAFALLFFVYGGFMWITSGGNMERVKKGRDVLVNSVIAIAIILIAFLLVRFVGDALGAKDARFGRYLEPRSAPAPPPPATPPPP